MCPQRAVCKKLFLICPFNLHHCSIILRPTTNPKVGKYAVVLNPTLHAVERPHPLPPNMNVIIWNCRGTHSPDFRRNFCYLLDYHRLALVALLETHLTDHLAIRDEFDFTNMAQVPVEGHSGGIIALWLNDLLTVDEIAMTHQEIQCMVQVLPLPHKWLFTAIYASNVHSDRCILWQNLKCFYDYSYKGPWLVSGDFNEILHATEKFGGNGLCLSRSNTF